MSPTLSRSLPFAAAMAFVVLADVMPIGIDGAWLYPLKVIAVGILLILLWREYGELRPYRLGLRPLLISLVSGVAVFALWIELDAGWMLLGGSDPGFETGDGDARAEAALLAFRVAGAVLVVPLAEELFWRSFLQRWLVQKDFLGLDPARSSFVAMLVTSLLFGLAHQQWLAGLVAGLVYGWLYKFTRSLWAPVIAHMVTNAALSGYVLATGRRQLW